VVFSLQADPALVTWSPVGTTGTALVQNLAVLDLGQGIPLVKYFQQGGLLQAGIFQKGQGNAAAMAGPLVRVVLVPAPGLVAGQAIALSAPHCQLFPDSGTQLKAQACAVGVLAAQ
jgi:hypothetical protein